MKYPRAHGAAVLALVVAGFTSTASAQTATSSEPFYLKATVGYAIGNVGGDGGTIVTGPGFGNNFGTSPTYGGGLGFRAPCALGPASFRFDITGAVTPSLGGGNHTGAVTDAFGTSTPLSAGVKLSNSTVLANIYADIDIGSVVTPFIGIGAGGAYNSVKPIVFSSPTGVIGQVDPGTHSSGAWSATAGATYALPVNNLSVEFAYRYTYAGIVESGPNYTDFTQSPIAVEPLTAEIKSRLDMHQFNVSLRYAF